MDKDLETLINKTGCMNDTCACLRKCLEGKECWYNGETNIYPLCDDYNTAKRLDNKINAWEIVKEYKVDLWLLSECDYEEYLRIRKEAQIENEVIPSDCSCLTEGVLPEEYFNFLKEMMK